MKNRTIELNGHSLTIIDMVNVARHGYQVTLDPAAQNLVEGCARAVESWVRGGKIVYGITTGFGDLSSVVIPADKSSELQRNLLLSHSL